jgi:peroxiredoxin
MESHDSFEIMTDFVDTLSDSDKLKVRLMDALNKKNPFREFKYVIDNSGNYRQKWFDFKNERIQKWVIDRLNEIVNIEE